jgi:hypothetical protein
MLAHQLPTLPNMSIPSSGRRRRTRKTSTQYGVTAVLAAVMLCAAGMVAMIVSVAGGRSDDATRPGTRIVSESLDLASLDAPVGTDRPIYRHSVIAGGVYTADELRDVLVQDAIAATHYQGFNESAIRTETVKQDRFAYVSYRKNDQIFWTRNKVKLSEGETVLTDGNKEIRARCGNCISETPQLPVAEIEPASVEFDQLVDDPGDPYLSAAIRSALESLAFGPTRRPGAAGGESTAGTSPNDSGTSASVASGNSGGGGGIRPTSLASRGPLLGGPAGSVGSGGGQPGVSPSSLGSTSTGDPDSPAPHLPSVGGSSPSPPVASAHSGSPSAAGSPGPAGPMAGAPFPESQFVPPGTAASIPPGIDPPPGFDSAVGVHPSASSVASSTVGPQDGSADDPVAASLPEPGMLLLLGSAGAAAVLRKLRRRN